MADHDSGFATVVYVGNAPEITDDALDIKRVGANAVEDHISDADCIVAEEPGDGLDVLASVVETGTPTILYDVDGDPAVAARATRLGVTEYVTDAGLEGETLTDRIIDVAGQATERDDGARETAALELLYEFMTDRSLSLEEKTERLLEVGCERLGLDIGFLANIEAETHTVVTVSGDSPKIESDTSRPLSQTYCRRTIAADGPLGIYDATATGNETDPAYQASGLHCYLGGKLLVDGELYGTLCFVGEQPRSEPFSESERQFVELLIEWVSYELEREDHERSLRWYKAIHETVEEMVFLVGENARIELLTQPLADRFGYDREELVDAPATEFIGDDVVTKGYDALAVLRSGAESVTIEATIETDTGEAVPVEVDFSLLSSATEFQGLVGVVHDRTELSRTEAELVGERNRFQHLFDQIPDAIADIEVVDDEPLVRAVNPAFEETFGHDSEAVVGEPLSDVVVSVDDHEDAVSLDFEAMQDGYEVPQTELRTANGIRTFLFRGFAYPAGDSDRGFLTYTDITDRLERERRLSVLHRVLRHNLRNEMTAIIGYADLLVESVENPTLREYAEVIQQRSNKVADLGKQVQRIEQALDRENRRRTAIDPVAVAETVAAEFQAAHPEATIRVVDEVATEVIADELLERSLGNLVENAIEHHDGTPAVDIELSAVGDWVDITVRDDGPGIPERERAVVSGRREITQLDHSVGLGLWVTRWIVDGVGGRLIFEEDANGSAVTLRLQRLSS